MEKVQPSITALIFLAIIVGFFYLIYKYSLKAKEENKLRDQKREKEKVERIQHYRRVKDNYFSSLNNLKNNPTDADLKMYTLGAGREYAELTRQYAGYDGVTLFDEVALMNDINAACAKANSMRSAVGVEVKQTIEQRLAKLYELKDKNLVSEQEYNERRQKILDEI